MSTKNQFNVTEFTNASGTTSYRVSGYQKDGSRIRMNFTDETKARLYAQKLEREYMGVPEPEGRSVFTRLSEEQIKQAELCFGMLAENMPGKTLSQALTWFMANYRETTTQILLPAAYTKFIAEKKAANLRPDTIRDLEDRIGRFCRLHPTKLVSDVLSDDIKNSINSGEKSPIAKANDRRVLFGFFKWATSQQYCGTNPVANVHTIKLDPAEPQILSNEECVKLLSAAAEFRNGVCVPYVALGLFCAIRPRELSRLTWEDLDLENGLVTIGPKIAKKRGRRIVEISENAVRFLSPHAKKGNIAPRDIRRLVENVKKLAGFGPEEIKVKDADGKAVTQKTNWKPMPPDAMRHTGITMHFSAHKHEGQTAAWAGNSPDVIHSHYKGLVKPIETRDFWAITPGSLTGKIVPLPTAAAA